MSNRIVPAKSFMTKTNLGNLDFTCNPYIGCTHGCVYCYAKTIERHHASEEWGKYVDIKTYPNTFIPKGTGHKSLFFSSMTDPYQPIENKTKSVRSILESIVEANLSISILTKSDLVARDIDLFKQMNDVVIGFSISMLDEEAKVFEPGASLPSKRILALKELHDAGIKTYVFVSPIIPYLSQPLEIIRQVKDDVDYMMFDSLNLKDDENKRLFFELIRRQYPLVAARFEDIFIMKNKSYYNALRKELYKECEKYNIPIHNMY